MSAGKYTTRVCVTPVDIEDTESISEDADLKGSDLVKVVIPPDFSGTAITLQASYDSLNWGDVEIDGEIYSESVLEDRTNYSIISLNLHATVSLRHVRVVSNAQETAKRTLLLISRPL